jgi:hypothetical protein
MKLNRSSLSLLTILLLAACSKTNNSPAPNGSFSAMVGGTAFTANQVAAADLPSALGPRELIVVGYYVQARDTTGLQVEMPYLPPVNRPFSTDTTTLAAITYVASGKRYDAYFGLGASRAVFTLTSVDSVNHNVAGVFSGTVYNDADLNDSLVITNGKFSSSYSVE